ncbi:hypothetical protein PAN31117_00932 [Pandoraea anapnoica]|uniref:Uncharacterized protein n=1 Tax=Pandoraea anapnoica TaxID=2508301 RepID=A0A5E4ZQT6_9BURK|nr:hypothetical protein [Pandoraea anapnoica]VVE62623.1 hypothetical protein PAN31117_00932 [Pandoraea anapnoica]
MKVNPQSRTQCEVRATDAPHVAASRVHRQYLAQGACMPACLDGLDWRVQVVYRNIMTSGHWGEVAAALVCELLGIDTMAAAGGSAPLQTPVARICDALAPGMTSVAASMGDWVRQFDDAWPICFDGRRFGVWCNGGPVWSPEAQGFGGLCHALCAAAWKCDVTSIEDIEIAPMLNALPTLILRNPEAAAAAFDAVLNHRQPLAQGGLSPVRALTLGGALLAGGACLAMAWPAAFLLAGAAEAAAVGVMLSSLPRGRDSTERIRLAGWFSIVLPELTVDQIHRLCDRLEGRDVRLDVVLLVAELKLALKDGSGRSPKEVIEQLPVSAMEQEAIARDLDARSLDRVTHAQALEAALYFLNDMGVLARSSQEISTRPYALRVGDWYEWLGQLDRDSPRVLRLSDRAAPRTCIAESEWRKFHTDHLAAGAQETALSTDRRTAHVIPTPTNHPTARAWMASVRAPVATTFPPTPVGSWGAVSASPFESHPMLSPMEDLQDGVSDAFTDAGHAVGAMTTGAALRRLRAGTANHGTLLMTVGGAVVTTSLLLLAYLLDSRATGSVDGQGHAVSPETSGDDPSAPQVPLALPVAQHRTDDDVSANGPSVVQQDPVVTQGEIDLRATLTPQQILTLSEWVGWHGTVGGAAEYRRYRERAVLHTKELVQHAYAAFHKERNDLGEVDWDARVEVRYQEHGFFPVSGNTGVGFKSRREFSLLQIAFGHHYYEESLSIGGSRKVLAVSAGSANGADTFERTQELLKTVNSDAFRISLHKLDLERINALSTSAEAIAGFSQYAKAILVNLLIKVRDVDRPSEAFWMAAPDRLQSWEMLEPQLELQLLTYRGTITPGLVALTHAPSRTALILSIKQQKWFWWRKDVELRDDWREFMRDHLSIRDIVEQEGGLYLMASRQFSIGSVCDLGEGCVRPRPGLRKAFAGVDRFSSLVPGFWAFAESSDIEGALWRAEVTRMRQNLDMQVVTPEIRGRRDWDDFRVAVLQGSMVFFPIAGGMFPAASATVDWSFRLTYAGVTSVYLSVLSKRAEYATLSELESIYSNMRFGMLMLLVNQIPAAEPLAKCVRLSAGFVSNAGRQILRQVKKLAGAGKPIIARRRELLADLAKELRIAPLPLRQLDAPWIPLKALKSSVRVSDDVVIGSASPTPTVPTVVLHFMGTSATLVDSEDVLLRMPPGYLVAFVSIAGSSSGRIIYAGVTCGSGTILGSCTEADVEPLPYRRFDMLDLRGKHRGALSFWDTGVVECDAELFSVWVESPVDALAEIKVSEGVLERARSEVARQLSAPDGSTPVRGVEVDDIVRKPRGDLVPASDPSLPKWDTMVSQWRACRYGGPMEASPSNDASVAVQEMASTAAVPSESLGEAKGASISTMALNHHWTPAFKTALNDIFEQVEAGLLLWHFGRMPPAQRAMMSARLRGTIGVRTLSLGGIEIPGVVAMQRGQDYLLMSLTTGEVSWEGDVQVATNAPLRRFLQRQVSDADAARLAQLLTGDAQPTPGQRPYEIVFQPPVRDFLALVDRANAWLANQISCFGNVDPPCEPVARDHDFSYLIAVAAAHCPGGEGQTIVNLVNALARPDERDYLPPEHIFRRDTDSPWRDTPGLPFARYLGESVAGGAADLFVSDRLSGGSPSVEQRVSDHVARSRERYALHVMRSEFADLVGFGTGDEAFGVAMSVAANELQEGRFGPALATVSSDLLPGYSGWAHMRQADEPRRIADASDMRRIPPGYRIFLTSENALDERVTGIRHEMLSLGNGTVAAWRTPGAGFRPSFAYRRLDLLSENGCLNVASTGVTLVDGTPVELWAEPGTPGVFGKMLDDAPTAGRITDIGILASLRANRVIDAEWRRNAGEAGCRFGDDTTTLMATMARILADGGVVDIRYRLVASWSGPNQAFPAVSLALTGEAPRTMLANGESGRLVVDLFMSRPLGADVSSVEAIQGEGDWLSTYRQHARGRCIQFREFADVSATVTALREYETVPGILSHDWREGTVLVSPPQWGSHPAPGWHPNRRASVCLRASRV